MKVIFIIILLIITVYVVLLDKKKDNLFKLWDNVSKTNLSDHPYKFCIVLKLPLYNVLEFKKIIPVIEYDNNRLYVYAENEISAIVILYFLLDSVLYKENSVQVINNDHLNELYTYVSYDKEYLNELLTILRIMVFKVNTNAMNYIKKKEVQLNEVLPSAISTRSNLTTIVEDNDTQEKKTNEYIEHSPINNEEIKLEDLGLQTKAFEPRNMISDRMNKDDNKDIMNKQSSTNFEPTAFNGQENNDDTDEIKAFGSELDSQFSLL